MPRGEYTIKWTDDPATMAKAIKEAEMVAAHLREYRLGFTHRCADCKAPVLAGSYRWTGERWEHRCPGVHGQAGHWVPEWEPIPDELDALLQEG